MARLASPPTLAAARRRLQPSSARRFGTVVLACSMLASSATWAQAPAKPSAAEQADAAFAEGRALFDQGRLREACEKFELSQRLDTSPGTLLNLGICYESKGDLALALTTFERALADARVAPDAAKKQLWSDAATEHISTLEQRIPQVTVHSAETLGRVLLDGQPLDRLDAPLRVNPGHHTLDAQAPGKQSHRREFDILAGQSQVIDLPALQLEPPPVGRAEPPAVPVEPPPAQVASTSRYGVWPWVLAGGGAALIASSLIPGLIAKGKAQDLKDDCDANKTCDPSLKGEYDSAKSLALTSDVLWITGAVVAGVGITLFIIDDGGTESGATLQAGCFDGGCGLMSHGRF